LASLGLTIERGFVSASSFHMFSKIHVCIVYVSYVVHFVLSSSKQTMLRGVGVLNTGSLPCVLITVL
jgi:hypothetical protein